jgi:DNA-binding transcriptional ArsR family regulator
VAQTLENVFAAIADPTRRTIIARLAHGSARISDIAASFTAQALESLEVSKRKAIVDLSLKDAMRFVSCVLLPERPFPQSALTANLRFL